MIKYATTLCETCKFKNECYKDKVSSCDKYQKQDESE